MKQQAISIALPAIVLAAGLLGVAHGLGSEPGRLSEGSAVAAAPQPTYVSELAPAVTQPPGEPAALPSAGAASTAAAPWPKVAGIGLALFGVLFIRAALSSRSPTTR